MVKKFFLAVKKIEEILLVILMIVMCTIVFIATVARFTNLFIISWAEELARYCMIWIIFLGIGVAAIDGEHFSVEALDLFVPKKVMKVIRGICAVIVLVFSLFAGYYGVKILAFQISGGQITPSLNWPMWLMYLAIPLGLVIMAVCYVYHTYTQITGKEDKKDEKELIEEGEQEV